MLQRAVEAWRAQPTSWNFGVGRLLREMSGQFESLSQLRVLAPDRSGSASAGGAAGSSAAGAALDRSFVGRLRSSFPGLHGFPMSFACGAEDQSWQADGPTNGILRQIRGTLLHVCDDPKASFALSVVAAPYTSKFATMWVFYAMLSELTN